MPWDWGKGILGSSAWLKQRGQPILGDLAVAITFGVLVLLGKVPMKKAIGTSLLIIAVNSVAGFVGYLGTVPLDWQLTVSFTFLAGVGTVAGAYLARHVSAQHLQKGFGYFLLAVATFVMAQNYYQWQNLNSNKTNSSQSSIHRGDR